MEVRELSSSRGLLLLFALLCGVRRFTKANPTAPCEWAATHLGYDPLAFTCTGLGLKIIPSESSTHALALDLSFSGIRRFDFTRVPPIAKVNLSHSCIAEVQKTAFAGFSDLEELDLSNNCLQIIRDGTLKGLGRLKTLDLRHNRISEVHWNAFTGLDAVQTVWLQNNKLDTIPEAISGLADLRVLSLANNQISRVDSRSFHGCRSLTALHLQHNRISALSVDAFRDLMKLQMLNLGTNLLETIPGSTLESLWGQGTDIRFYGNPWRCDCGLTELRVRAPTWLTGRVWCHGGPLHGVPLSSLGLGQLVCKRTLRVSQTLTANIMEDRGLRIPCGNGSERGEAQYWHTPFGRLENSSVQSSGEPVAMLRDGSIKITSATRYHTGLYYCLWAARDGRVILPYRVEYTHSAVSGGPRPRKTREAEGYQETVSADHFVAAVASGAVVAFLVGFALGAFSRTYLSRGFHRLTRRQRQDSGGVHMGTLPWQYENETFRKDGGPKDTSSSEGTPSVTSPPEANASLGAAYLEGSDSGRESQGGEEAQTGEAGSGGAREQGGQDRGGSAETDPGSERGVRPSKRRVIKVYNYDEEGNKYGHVRDSGDEGAPGMKHRTLSLTRLSTIMAAATGPAFSRESPQGDTEEQTDPGDGRPVFNLSI
ncbi:leucine-rich repeat-containing protein 24 [Anguilla rostrata]|uniref:leucine-rich repeat-containing protein 24 n=1 Tax=Anguilla rostrata TaxID=7938 RepID=UPI0030D1848E